MEDVEKQKAIELEKINKEKKALEQRQKNLQMVSAGTKREREEIDQLKREISKITQDASERFEKSKKENDRLRKLNQELQQKN